MHPIFKFFRRAIKLPNKSANKKLKLNQIEKVETDRAPRAIGPYSQATVAGDFIFVSGQLPLDPETGEMAAHIVEQTRRVLENIRAILEAANCEMQQVVRMEIYLQDLSHFAVVNEIYADFFAHSIKPARQTVEVSSLPKDALIEISCVAYRPGDLSSDAPIS